MINLKFTQVAHSVIYDSKNQSIYEKLFALDSTGQIWKYNFSSNQFDKLNQGYIGDIPNIVDVSDSDIIEQQLPEPVTSNKEPIGYVIPTRFNPKDLQVSQKPLKIKRKSKTPIK